MSDQTTPDETINRVNEVVQNLNNIVESMAGHTSLEVLLYHTVFLADTVRQLFDVVGIDIDDYADIIAAHEDEPYDDYRHLIVPMLEEAVGHKYEEEVLH